MSRSRPLEDPREHGSSPNQAPQSEMFDPSHPNYPNHLTRPDRMKYGQMVLVRLLLAARICYRSSPAVRSRASWARP
jgi:hypothetical protein